MQTSLMGRMPVLIVYLRPNRSPEDSLELLVTGKWEVKLMVFCSFFFPTLTKRWPTVGWTSVQPQIYSASEDVVHHSG